MPKLLNTPKLRAHAVRSSTKASEKTNVPEKTKVLKKTNASEKTKVQPDICNAMCPSRDLLELLAEKWALLVIFRLHIKSHRTAELRREIGGVSEKMLIQTLRKLERYGLVSRHDHGEVPPRVEYELTELGLSLATPVRQIEGWVAQNLKDVMKAKEQFDKKSLATKVGTAKK